ncbi:L domain-like protein [Neocallimastix sp. 'constans']
MILYIKLLLSLLLFISVIYSKISPFEYNNEISEDEDQNIESDCLDIKSISEDISCYKNDKGEVAKIEVRPESFNEKLLNYKTITNITYTIDIELDYEKSKEKIYNEFPESLLKFSNLKYLALNYHGYEEFHTHSTYEDLPIDKNYISRLPKTLEELTLSHIDLKQYNIDEIASLSNLKALNLFNCNIENVKFSSLENNNISELRIYYSSGKFYGYHLLEKNIFKYFKSLKKLSIDGVEISQDNINEIGTLTDIEELNIKLHSNLKLDPLQNLNKLSVANIGYYERNMDDSEYEDEIELVLNLKLPTNIRELYLENVKLSQSNLDLISTFKNLEKLIIYVESSLKYDSLKSLSKLTDLKIINYYKPLNLKIPKSIKNLYLIDVNLSQENIDEISTANIEKLSLVECYFANDIKFDSFKTLNLKKLSIAFPFYNDKDSEDKNYGKLKEIPELFYSFKDLEELYIKKQRITSLSNKIGNLKNLKILNLRDNDIENLPEEVSKLDNLEILDLSHNKIYADLPESYNHLSKLTEIDLSENLNIRGKTLTNESLKKCYYSEKYYLCKVKDMDCLGEDIQFEKCSNSNSSRCGKDDGKCPNGQCCNKEGYCGTDESYCSLEKGCQNNYGLCDNECNEIEYYLKKKDIDTEFMECSADSEGKVTHLDLHRVDLHEEDFKKVISYDTINSLIYSECYLINDNDFELQEISQMKNLKHLELWNFIYLKNITQHNIDLLSNLTNLEDLIFEYCEFESNGVSLKPLEDLKKLKELVIYSDDEIELIEYPSNIPSLNSLTLHTKLTQKQFNDITSLTNLKELDLDRGYYNSSPLNLDKLKNLKNLEVLLLANSYNLSEFPESIYSLTHLKNLTLTNSEITSFPKKLTKLTDLRYINFSSNKLKEVPDSIGSLENLDTLILYMNDISKVSEKLNNCKNLEYLNLNYNSKIKGNLPNLENLEKLRKLGFNDNGLTKFPKWIGNLKNLEYLDLNYNNIDDEIPESYSLLPNLKYFSLYGNENISGKYLINPSLEECLYDDIENNKLCKEPDIKIPCLENAYESDYDKLKICESNTKKTSNSKTTIKGKSTTTIPITTSTSTTTTTTTTSPTASTTTTTKKKNNSKIATTSTTTATTTTKKKNNSKITIISTTTKTTTKTKTTNIPVATNKEGKCGKNYGRCPSGECCSKYGYCGTSSKYCDISKGCQSEFGKCTKDEDKGKCGKGYGKCPSGECCSKYGYCGTSSKYCDISKGCQSEFGKCN